MTALPPPRTEDPAAETAEAAAAADAPAAAEPAADAPGDTAADAASEPAADAAAPAQPRPDRRSLGLMLLFAVVGAAVVLLSVGQTWARGSVAFQDSTLHISASGSQTTGVPSALALVGLAAAVAVFAVRGFGRRLVGALLALAGAGAAVVSIGAATGSAALDHRAAAAVGLSQATVGQVSHAAWPWLAALGGVLLLLAGVLVITRGRDWPGMSSRYEAPTGRRVVAPGAAAKRTAGTEPSSPNDLWKALDRGEDPTA